MTIAACYLSPEGVVFGADSTATFPTQNGPVRHYEHAQKVFELGGVNSTLGIVFWGLGGLPGTSHRTMVAQFAERNEGQPTNSLQDVTDRYAQFFWQEYTVRFATSIARLRHLIGQSSLSPDEQKERNALQQGLAGGFCVGGNLLHDRTPVAIEILYNPLSAGPVLRPLNYGEPGFWGVPNVITRMLLGIDPDLYVAILQSGKWSGTPAELSNLVNSVRLLPPGILPIREAIDWLHASVYATIKTMKFSQLSPVCGGPVEIAVITSDRPFRWVRHKRLSTAIAQGGYTDEYPRTG